MIDLKTDLALTIQDNFRLKHLSGQHDQKLHGVWANGGKISETSPKYALQTQTPAFKRWFGKSQVLDEDGNPKVVYHGTTHDFTKFTNTLANPDNYLGGAHYFTDTIDDVNANYAGVGPDLDNRIAQMADQLMGGGLGREKEIEILSKLTGQSEEDIQEKIDNGDLDLDSDTAKAVAKACLTEHEGVIMPVYLKMTKPANLDPWDNNRTMIDTPYKERKLLKAIREVMDENGGDADQLIADLIDNSLFSGEGDSLEEILKQMQKSEAMTTLEGEDDQGNYVLLMPTVQQKILKRMGYDGAIVNADYEFGFYRQHGKPMEGISNTRHYIVWDGKQIKSAIGNSGDFSLNTTDITKELREFALKHLAGQHDQSTHGSWAGGSRVREDAPHYVSESMVVHDVLKNVLANPNLSDDDGENELKQSSGTILI